jgi:hypothetical protein
VLISLFTARNPRSHPPDRTQGYITEWRSYAELTTPGMGPPLSPASGVIFRGPGQLKQLHVAPPGHLHSLARLLTHSHATTTCDLSARAFKTTTVSQGSSYLGSASCPSTAALPLGANLVPWHSTTQFRSWIFYWDKDGKPDDNKRIYTMMYDKEYDLMSRSLDKHSSMLEKG